MCIAQGRGGVYSQAVREKACEDLVLMFRPLLITIARKLWYRFKDISSEEFGDFYHNAVLIAIELILQDYVPQKYGGRAYFAHYLRRKLFMICLGKARMNARVQQRLEPFDYSDDIRIAKDLDSLYIIEEITEIDSTSINDLPFTEVDKRLADVLTIAKDVLNEIDFVIWQYVLLRGHSYTQVAEQLKKRDPDAKYVWTKQRVYNAFNGIRQKVMAAYGAAVLSGKV